MKVNYWTGEVHWTQQWGTEFQELSSGLTLDDKGNAYVAGHISRGPDVTEIFVKKYTPAGESHWTKKLNSSNTIAQ
eukprot:3056398-Amphidinium_carterae.1